MSLRIPKFSALLCCFFITVGSCGCSSSKVHEKSVSTFAPSSSKVKTNIRHEGEKDFLIFNGREYLLGNEYQSATGAKCRSAKITNGTEDHALYCQKHGEEKIIPSVLANFVSNDGIVLP